MARITLGNILLVIHLLWMGQICRATTRDGGMDTYDSTRNYLGDDYKLYVGQTLIFCPLTDSVRDYKYFANDPEVELCNMKNIYQPNKDSTATAHDSLMDRRFYVSGVKRMQNEVWLILSDQNNRQFYYRYYTYTPSKFPFVVEGFYRKMAQRFLNKGYYARRLSIGYSDSLKDYYSSEKFQLRPGELYKCENVFINFWGVQLLFKNDSNSFIIPAAMESMDYYLMSTEQAVELEREFGAKHSKEIVRGNVIKGMTQREVRLSLGDPQTVVIENKNKYQWTYTKRYRRILVNFKGQRVKSTEIIYE